MASPTAAPVQRRKENRKKGDARVIRLQLKDGSGNTRLVTADLLDVSAGGIGISLLRPLSVGAVIEIRGNLGEDRTNSTYQATVKWCVERSNGNFHAGLELVVNASGAPHNSPPRTSAGKDEADWYEVMQLSPNADAETIARVYRILAQRYHPDSPGGNQELFLRLSEAHRVLSNPELRALYDVRHRDVKQRHWDIFDRPELPSRQEGERRKRQGILEALYAKALQVPEKSTMGVMDLENLLGCPREHLEAALWYLKAKGCLKRADNGRFSITAAGFDAVEGASQPGPGNDLKMLEAGPSR